MELQFDGWMEMINQIISLMPKTYLNTCSIILRFSILSIKLIFCLCKPHSLIKVQSNSFALWDIGE